ncbi:hypothetical protein UFOVP181_71 [uncultured Caudovirales phage]|uniref:Uncharacterized protein n=1 Tax=uncultured Caudovirales phage TaxID=2100421 RepID=A0A6J7WKM0_9CAUD|nr:hypothetical protein UFOVP57_91 [uncultured Caudovirales phage]CAB5208564.1 hypothetical protein UFOVP181_71 [uncultured Caudovirales phage]
MKMADILHKIADLIDQTEGGEESSDRPENTGKSSEDFQHDVDDGAESGGSDKEVGKFVPPLQAKLELLKKASGVDSHYDDEGSDELDDIKKLTGIKAVIQQEAGEDNDITG